MESTSTYSLECAGVSGPTTPESTLPSLSRNFSRCKCACVMCVHVSMVRVVRGIGSIAHLEYA